MPKLLEIEGARIALDAMHCQKKTAQAIIQRKTGHVLTAKGNQKKNVDTTGKGFVAFGDLDQKVKGLRQHVTNEKSHGHHERRECYCIAIDDDDIFADWPGAKTIGMFNRHRDDQVGEHDETMFFISSLPQKKRLKAPNKTSCRL